MVMRYHSPENIHYKNSKSSRNSQSQTRTNGIEVPQEETIDLQYMRQNRSHLIETLLEHNYVISCS